MSVTVALPKGKLLAGAQTLFRRAHLPFPEGEGRRLHLEIDGFRFLFLKDQDVPTYVEHGVADCGVAGRDVLLESEAEVYEPLDLGFGFCRLVVAVLAGRPSAPAGASGLRVATKYPRIARAHFLEKGVSAEIVGLAGSVEIAPGLGLADCIVDVVETGRTLTENGLEVVEEVAASSARFIVNRASYHSRRQDVFPLIEALRKAAS